MGNRATKFSYIETGRSGYDLSAIEVGGDVKRFTGLVALLVGDYVYLSATAGVVTKSTTIANYANVQVGIVVGGRSTNGQIIDEARDIANSIPACGAGQEVLVQVGGIAYTIADAATGIGAVIPSATVAGRTGLGTTAGQILGVRLETAAAIGSIVRTLIAPR